MRNGLLGALAALLVGNGLALAQPGSLPPALPSGVLVPPTTGVTLGPLPPAESPGLPVEVPYSGPWQPQPGSRTPNLKDWPDDRPLCPHGLPEGKCDKCAQEHAPKDELWFTGDYLLWWFRNGGVPPLVTSGSTGILGQSGTTIVLDNVDFDNDFRSGGRFTVGWRFKHATALGIEASYFFISDRTKVAEFSSPGSPVLARPFFNFLTGQEDAGLVASPATGPGAIEVATSTSLWGAESNLALCIWHAPNFMHLTLLGGFRYLELEEQFDTSERFTAAAEVPVFGGSALQVADHFGTRNQFYGGQLGAEFGVELGRFFMDLRGKIALGTNQEELQIAGATIVSGGGGAGTFAGGRMALPTNTGHFDREKFTFVPEFGVNVGFQATRCLRLFAGYTFLFWNDATRPGEQIDRTVNLSQVPSAVGPGTLAGAAHPVPLFRDTEFWAQGFNFGFEVRY